MFFLIKVPKNCQEVLNGGSTVSGVYIIYPDGVNPIIAYCEQQLDGGGWTVSPRHEFNVEHFE